MGKGYGSPEDAENAFYNAFQAKDIQAMENVWLDAGHVECIHPMGSRLLGYEEVVSGWRQIFSNESTLMFQLENVNKTSTDEVSVHILHEKISTTSMPGKSTTVISTNVYRNDGGRWYMVLHHASLSPQEEDSDDVEARQIH